jgi:hypothetical protein
MMKGEKYYIEKEKYVVSWSTQLVLLAGRK